MNDAHFKRRHQLRFAVVMLSGYLVAFILNFIGTFLPGMPIHFVLINLVFAAWTAAGFIWFFLRAGRLMRQLERETLDEIEQGLGRSWPEVKADLANLQQYHGKN